MPSLFHVRPIQIEKMWQVYVFFYVFFWLFGEKYIPLHWFCNMLIINAYLILATWTQHPVLTH